ncbi:MAG: radical SAM protein [Candidatus Peregrinibacteria bacterium]
MSFYPTPSHLTRADLLLINPDFSKNELGVASAPENHLGLNRIASYLADRGHTVQVMDTTGRPSGTTGPEELGDWLLANADNYEAIGFHSNSWNINHILRTLKRALPKLKDKRLLFGGPLPNSEPLKTTELFSAQGLNHIGVVQGLGEKITDEILRKDKLLGIDSLWAFEKGQLQRGRKVAMTSDEYEKTPFLGLQHNTFYQNYWKPAMESGDLGKYPMDIIFSSQGLDCNRGCVFNCTYCSVPQYEKSLILMSPKRVVDELEHLAKEAGFFMFTFTNSNIMFFQQEWIEAFCREIIGRGMDSYLNWTAYHHPSIIAPLSISVYDLMRKAGSDTLVFGVQSFEEKINKLFLRPQNTRQLTGQIIEKCKQAKLHAAVDYITGVPGENLDIVEEAFDYFIANDVECRNYQLKFYPNTKLPTMGLDLSDHDLVPITGNLAPELEAYGVVPKKPNPRAAELDSKIREHNAALAARRKPRLGKYVLDTPERAREALKDIQKNAGIPPKVKEAMTLAIREMLNPKKPSSGLADLSPAEMMKVVITAGPDSPPMVQAMQNKLRAELGPAKFAKLRAQYENAGL